jgi:F0F1-type ATP synthase epsilon subunit
MSLPVSPSTYIYSHFKHVSGIPAPEGTQGVNISRLKIIDTLIEHLSSMKKQPIINFNVPGEMDEKQINALIEQYQKQMKTAQATPVYSPAAPVTGAIFNIAA